MTNAATHIEHQEHELIYDWNLVGDDLPKVNQEFTIDDETGIVDFIYRFYRK